MSDDNFVFTDGLSKLRAHLREYELPEYGNSPRDCVFHIDKIRLYRYQNAKLSSDHTLKDGRSAVLIVYALVNRPWILDLQEKRSFIQQLLKAGMDVYLLDWGYPDSKETRYGMDKYILEYLNICVNKVNELANQQQLHLLGVCQGGTLSLCYTALNSEKVASLTCMVTPVDFATKDNTLAKWAQFIDTDRLVETFGNIPGSYLDTVFRGLKPFTNGARKYMRMIIASGKGALNTASLENFIAMERWLMDTPDQPGVFFKQFIQWLYQENRLVKGELVLAGNRVNLANLQTPVLNIMASQDHLVPNSSTLALKQFIPDREYSEVSVEAGHIGIFVGKESLASTPALIANWVKEQSQNKCPANPDL